MINSPRRLRHAITIQQMIQTRDATNRSVKKEYVDFVNVLADVEALSGRKFWATRMVNSETTHEIRIRYQSGITPSTEVPEPPPLRILWEGQKLDVQEVKPDARRLWIYMTAKEVH